jgi:hypothetical protein
LEFHAPHFADLDENITALSCQFWLVCASPSTHMETGRRGWQIVATLRYCACAQVLDHTDGKEGLTDCSYCTVLRMRPSSRSFIPLHVIFAIDVSWNSAQTLLTSV